jgi:hypothetical protein
MKDGVTARGYFDEESLVFNIASATKYAASGVSQERSRMPVVRVRQMNATTVLFIEAVIHLQVESTGQSSPILTTIMQQQNYEPEFKQLMSYCNSKPHSTTAHSFKTFLQGIGRGIGKVFRFVTGNLSPIGGFLKAVKAPNLAQAAVRGLKALTASR